LLLSNTLEIGRRQATTPKKTPRSRSDKPDIRWSGERVAAPSGHRLRSSPGFGLPHKAEIEKWWPIIKAAAIKPE
jgi:hypothetical protein